MAGTCALLALLALAGCGLDTAGLAGDDAPADGIVHTDGDARVEADGRVDDGARREDGAAGPDADADADAGADDDTPPPPPSCGDGTVDPGEECEPGDSLPCTTACGTAGDRRCTGVCTWDACASADLEMCNGFDDDCNGLTDDGPGRDCILGTSQACGSCSLGSQTCGGSCTWEPCDVPASVCEPGATRACGASSCGEGSQTCGTSCSWAACVPPVTECMPGATGSCSIDGCGTGTRVCTEACAWGGCTGGSWECTDPWGWHECTDSHGCRGYRMCDWDCTWDVCMTLCK